MIDVDEMVDTRSQVYASECSSRRNLRVPMICAEPTAGALWHAAAQELPQGFGADRSAKLIFAPLSGHVHDIVLD